MYQVNLWERKKGTENGFKKQFVQANKKIKKIQ